MVGNCAARAHHSGHKHGIGLGLVPAMGKGGGPSLETDEDNSEGQHYLSSGVSHLFMTSIAEDN